MYILASDLVKLKNLLIVAGKLLAFEYELNGPNLILVCFCISKVSTQNKRLNLHVLIENLNYFIIKTD